MIKTTLLVFALIPPSLRSMEIEEKFEEKFPSLEFLCLKKILALDLAINRLPLSLQEDVHAYKTPTRNAAKSLALAKKFGNKEKYQQCLALLANNVTEDIRKEASAHEKFFAKFIDLDFIAYSKAYKDAYEKINKEIPDELKPLINTDPFPKHKRLLCASRAFCLSCATCIVVGGSLATMMALLIEYGP
jgi:hypothetical protein